MSEPVQQAEAYFAETTADDSERQRLAYIQSSFDPKSIQDLTRIGVEADIGKRRFFAIVFIKRLYFKVYLTHWRPLLVICC